MPLGLVICIGKSHLLAKILAGGTAGFIAIFAAAYSSDLAAHQVEFEIQHRTLINVLADENLDIADRKIALQELEREWPTTRADPTLICRYSVILLIATIISGASCIALREMESKYA